MRIVLASLLATGAAIGAFVTVAQAQTPAAPAAPPASAAQTPAPTTAAPPATPAPPTATPDASATPPAAPAAPAAEAPPTLPTTGDGAQIIQLVEKFCVPLVRGGNFDQLAKANGMKNNRRDGTWSIQLGTTSKDYSVTFSSPGVNKDVCRGEVHYAVGQDKPIVEAINIWSFLHQPELILQANYVAVDPDGIKRVRKSWEHLDAGSSTAVNFSTWTKPDDSSLNAKFSTGEIFYQERKLG
ncbi:MAG: hypothetical protein ACXWKN_01695 [Phenylobacterium sp.]